MECNYYIHICIGFFTLKKELWSDIFRCECLTRVCLHMCSCIMCLVPCVRWVIVALPWQENVPLFLRVLFAVFFFLIFKRQQSVSLPRCSCKPSGAASCLRASTSSLLCGWPWAEHLSGTLRSDTLKQAKGVTLTHSSSEAVWRVISR